MDHVEGRESVRTRKKAGSFDKSKEGACRGSYYCLLPCGVNGNLAGSYE